MIQARHFISVAVIALKPLESHAVLVTVTPMQRHRPQSATICIIDSRLKLAARNAEAVVTRPAPANGGVLRDPGRDLPSSAMDYRRIASYPLRNFAELFVGRASARSVGTRVACSGLRRPS
jgi:hypothetical protein